MTNIFCALFGLGSDPGAFCVSAPFLLTAALSGRHYHVTHFTDEQTEEQQRRLVSFPEVSQPAGSATPDPSLFATHRGLTEIALATGEFKLGSGFDAMATATCDLEHSMQPFSASVCSSLQ